MTVHKSRVGVVRLTTCYGPDGAGFESVYPSGPRGLRRGSVTSHLVGLRVRIPSGAWMFVLCVVSQDKKKAKARIIKTKKQVRIKYKERTRE